MLKSLKKHSSIYERSFHLHTHAHTHATYILVGHAERCLRNWHFLFHIHTIFPQYATALYFLPFGGCVSTRTSGHFDTLAPQWKLGHIDSLSGKAREEYFFYVHLKEIFPYLQKKTICTFWQLTQNTPSNLWGRAHRENPTYMVCQNRAIFLFSTNQKLRRATKTQKFTPFCTLHTIFYTILLTTIY